MQFFSKYIKTFIIFSLSSFLSIKAKAAFMSISTHFIELEEINAQLY